MGDITNIILYLPSSVKDSVRKNTVSHYTTTLATPITLPDGYIFEAALLKLVYPCHANNVSSGSIEYWSFETNGHTFARIPDGEYSLPEGLIAQFQKILGAYDFEYYKLSADKTAQRFMLECKSDGKHEPFLRISENLQSITSLPAVVYKVGHTVGTNYYDQHGGIENLYVYMDFIKNTIIGDTVAPIINASAFKGKVSSDIAIEFEPQMPIYVELSKNYIDTITVELRTKTGDYFPFVSGESLCVVNVRVKSSRI
jgi:hypothetical protein